MREFAKSFVKKKLDDEKEYLTLRLKKITKKQTKTLKDYLRLCLDQFTWEPAEEKSG